MKELETAKSADEATCSMVSVRDQTRVDRRSLSMVDGVCSSATTLTLGPSLIAAVQSSISF